MKASAFSPRTKTDVFTNPEIGYAKFEGYFNRLVSFTMQESFFDPALWSLFVAQFRLGNTDDADNGWRGEFWGKMMRGAVYTYAYQKNEVLYGLMEQSVKELLTVQDALGRFSTYSVEHEFNGWDVWNRKYIMLGLEYFAEICRDEDLYQKIIAALIRHADYITEKIGDKAGQVQIYNTSEWWHGINASSVLEPFVKLYVLTNKQSYLDFAEYIIKSGAATDFDLFETAYQNKLAPHQYPTTKAYEMMSCFEGLLEYYRITGIEKYKTAVINFAEQIIKNEVTVVGSIGTTHELFDHSAVHQCDPQYTGIMQETCVTVTWMKLCHQLLLLTGDSKYADHMEISALNALQGAVNINKNKYQGQVMPFDSYSPLINGTRGRQIGGFKFLLNNRFYWGCCAAIANAGMGLYPFTAVLGAENGIALTMFMPGAAQMRLSDGEQVTLHIQTAYPQNGEVNVRIGLKQKKHFTLYVRIPSYSIHTRLTVNGEAYRAVPGEYCAVERDFSDGDCVILSLDNRIRLYSAQKKINNLPEESFGYVAVTKGPIVFAYEKTGADAPDTPKNSFIVKNENCLETGDWKKAEIPCQQCLTLKTEQGDMTVYDYASVGQTWEKERPVTVWFGQ